MSKNCLENLLEENFLADTHIHLHSPEYKNRLGILFDRAEKLGVREIWLVATDFHTSLRNIEIASEFNSNFSKNYPDLKLRLGIGFDMELLIPGSDIFSHNWFTLEKGQLIEKLKTNFDYLEKEIRDKGLELDLVGEFGLDYYWLGLNETLAEVDRKRSKILQQELFDWQLNYALERKLPVSIHSRGAETTVVQTLKDYVKKGLTGILHSFTGNQIQLVHAESGLNIAGQQRFLIGVNGIFTYSNAKSLQQMLIRKIKKALSKAENNKIREKLVEPASNKKKMPTILELLYKSGIVLETDGPYLIPGNANHQELLRVYGKKGINEPASVVLILDRVLKELKKEGLA